MCGVELDVVALAAITDRRLLLVSKREAPDVFYLPGGKREPGEDDLAALARELEEELGVALVDARLLGRFEAPAANEVGATVRSSAYIVEVVGKIEIRAEIEALHWIDPSAPPDLPIAPLLAGQILPALNAPSEASASESH